MKKGGKKRVWLNSVNSYHTGWIKYGVHPDPSFMDWDAEFKLADCSRSIDLSLDIHTKKERIKSIKKLQIIVDAALETIQQIKDIGK